ncbi:MAG: hypothetical protein U0W24_08895 [Bacteroidales bacterium]
MKCKIIPTAAFVLISAYNVISQDSKTNTEESIQSIKKRGYSIEACYRLADEFLNSTTEQRKGIPYYEYIIANENEPKPEVYQKLAKCYYFNGTYELAVKLQNEYILKEKNGKLKKEAKTELEKYENAMNIASRPIDLIMVNLGPQVNSKSAEINPYVSASENLLVYSSNRGNDFNIYVSKKPNNASNWDQSKLAGNLVNTINDEFVAGLSANGSNLFVHYNQVSGFEDINESMRSKGLFRELEDPGNKINSTYREEGACISKNQDTLYFASDRPGGLGGFDIYFSLRLPDGNWGPPINMGQPVNTAFDENYPNLSQNGRKLYFASKGHGSIGGYDLFYSTFNALANSWSAPVNLGFPINNAYDNKNISFTENERYAYISSTDKNSLGDFDIYKIIFLKNEPDLLIIKGQVYITENELSVPFNSTNENLSITVFKGNKIFGIYALDKRNNTFILALPPGEFVLELKSDNFEKVRKKIKIDENYYSDNQRVVKINLVNRKSK